MDSCESRDLGEKGTAGLACMEKILKIAPDFKVVPSDGTGDSKKKTKEKMKKIFALLTVVTASLSMAAAQSLIVTVEGDTVVNGETYRVSKEVNPTDYVFSVPAYMTLTNTSAADLELGTVVTSADLDTAAGYTLQFCGFMQCYDYTDVPNHTLTAGQVVGEDHVDDALDVQYNVPYEHPAGEPFASATATVTFSDLTNGGSISFNIEFVPVWAGGSANEGLADRVAIVAYPNPAVDKVTFHVAEVAAGSQLVLRDLTGKTVKTLALDGEAEVEMSVADLSGMYFYSVEENGKNVATGKLVVR